MTAGGGFSLNGVMKTPELLGTSPPSSLRTASSASRTSSYSMNAASLNLVTVKTCCCNRDKQDAQNRRVKVGKDYTYQSQEASWLPRRSEACQIE